MLAEDACRARQLSVRVRSRRRQFELQRKIAYADAMAPLVVGVEDRGVILDEFTITLVDEPRQRYYFWFFGYVTKLPFETSPQL